MKELSSEARRLLALARHQDDPDAAAQSRVERALAGRIAAGAVAGGEGATPLKSVSGSGAGLSAAKTVVVASVVGAVGAVWLAALSSGVQGRRVTENAAQVHAQRVDQEPPPPVSVSPSASYGDEAAPLQVANKPSSTVRKKTTRTVPRAGGTDGVPAATFDPLAAETAALLSTQQALRDGNARLALARLAEQDVTFRAGALQEERAAARVLALCQSGLPAEARAEAERFEQRWPRSALVGRVRSACRTPLEP